MNHGLKVGDMVVVKTENLYVSRFFKPRAEKVWKVTKAGYVYVGNERYIGDKFPLHAVYKAGRMYRHTLIGRADKP